MGAQGTATLDFGSFPGSSVAVVDASAPGVVAGSAVEAWLRPVATADHTDIDHVAAPMKVIGSYLSDGNLRIYGINQSDVVPPLEPQPPRADQATGVTPGSGGSLDRQPAPMFVGQFSVGWVWV